MTNNEFVLLNSKLITVFRQYGVREIYNPWQIIFTKNEEAQNLYYIQSGMIRVYIPYPDGTERTLCYFPRNTIVGEDAFNFPQRRIVCTDTLNKSVLYRCSAKELLQKAIHNPDLTLGILTFFMRKITLLHSWIFYAQFQRNEEKIACLLYTISSTSNSPIKLTHGQIAEVTGMSRVTATRILDSLAKKNIIAMQYKNLEILDKQTLREIFENKEFY